MTCVLTCLLTCVLTCVLTRLRTRLLTRLLTYFLTRLLTRLLIRLLIRLLESGLPYRTYASAASRHILGRDNDLSDYDKPSRERIPCLRLNSRLVNLFRDIVNEALSLC